MSTSAYANVKNESDFPTAMPPYGLWWKGSHRFTLHKSLTAVKGAISSSQDGAPTWTYNGSVGSECFAQELRVYEMHNGTWIELYRMKKGTNKHRHELWRDGAAPTGPQAIDEDDIEAAIRSIRSTMNPG